MTNTNITAFHNYVFEHTAETLHLSSIPGMVDSIKAAAQEPLEECAPYDPEEPW